MADGRWIGVGVEITKESLNELMKKEQKWLRQVTKSAND